MVLFTSLIVSPDNLLLLHGAILEESHSLSRLSVSLQTGGG